MRQTDDEGLNNQQTNAPSQRDSSKSPGSAGWKFWLRWIVAAVVVVFLVLTVRSAFQEISARQDAFDIWRLDWRILAFALVVYCAGLFPPGIGWMRVLSDFGQRLPRFQVLQAFMIGYLGKYVPGKAMVLILRVGKLQPHGLTLRAGIVSVFVETLTSVCIASILGGVLILALDVPSWIKWSAVVCLPFAGLALTPHFFRMLLFAAAKSKIGKMPKSIMGAFTPKFMARTSFWMLCGWLLQGTGGWIVLLAMSPAPELWSFTGWASVVCAVCLGAVAGFASMLPGGAVVREIVVTWLLAPLVTQPVALLAAVITRLVHLSSECLMVAVFMRTPKTQKGTPKQDVTAAEKTG